MGIVLVALLVVGGVGTVVYLNIQQERDRENQLVLQTAKNAEQTAANQAPDQITITCFTVTNDTSHLTYSPYYSSFSGYAIIYETFGVSNPTKFSMDATWTLTFSYTSVGWDPDFTQFMTTLDGTYTVTGTYSTYSVTQHQTYDSTTTIGGSSIGSANSLPKC